MQGTGNATTVVAHECVEMGVGAITSVLARCPNVRVDATKVRFTDMLRAVGSRARKLSVCTTGFDVAGIWIDDDKTNFEYYERGLDEEDDGPWEAFRAKYSCASSNWKMLTALYPGWHSGGSSHFAPTGSVQRGLFRVDWILFESHRGRVCAVSTETHVCQGWLGEILTT